MQRPIKVLFLTSTPVEGACTRFRAVQYFPYLETRGVECILLPFMSRRFFGLVYSPGNLVRKMFGLCLSILRRFIHLAKVLYADAVFIQREAMIVGPPIIEAIIAKVLHKPIIYDIDDAVFVPYVSPTFGRALSLLKWFVKTDYILRNSTHVIAGNAYLAEYAGKFNNNVTIIPSTVDIKKISPNHVRDRSSDLVIGWIGSHSSTRYFKTILPVFESLARKYAFKLKVVGANEAFDLPGIDVLNLEWAMERELEDFQSLDIGVYPIIEDNWSVGKSGLKAIQYMAVGAPAVCSPVGVVKQIIDDGINGFLARSLDEWEEKMGLLLEHPQLRDEMGKSARIKVEKLYSAELWGKTMGDIIIKCMNSKA